jgi:hypothetical protein
VSGDQAELPGPRGGPGAVGGAELAQDVRHVLFTVSSDTNSSRAIRWFDLPAAISRSPGCQCPAGPMTIQVILADDQPLVCAGLRRLIEQTPDIDVAREAGTGTEAAVQLVRDTSPTRS